MSTTLTLKNIPEDLYTRLKWSAETHRRSLNSEAILCLETVLAPAAVSAGERLQRARTLRAALANTRFSPDDIDQFKRSGRP
jgi:plasmid stability protein